MENTIIPPLKDIDNIPIPGKKMILTSVKRKRRSKNDFEGRSFKCPDCGKGYLSMPALNNHRKTKHDFGKYGERKGRGRPRKEPLIFTPDDIIVPSQNANSFQQKTTMSYSRIEKKYKIFFEKEYRKPIPNEMIDVDYLHKIFDIIFSLCKLNFYNLDLGVVSYNQYYYFNFILTNWNKNDLFNIMIFGTEERKEEEKEININEKKKTLSIDKTFLLFLKGIAAKTNREYFEIITKCIIMLREGINSNQQNSNYSSKTNAEDVPEMLNDIIDEFFKPNYFFGIDIKELVEIISHLCHWIYRNNYSTKKVTY